MQKSLQSFTEAAKISIKLTAKLKTWAWEVFDRKAAALMAFERSQIVVKSVRVKAILIEI